MPCGHIGRGPSIARTNQAGCGGLRRCQCDDTSGRRIAAPAHFENDGHHIIVRPARSMGVGDKLDILVDYTLNDPKSGLHFFAPSEEEPNEPYLLWSQGQSIDNRYWVPCFDHPNEMQTTELLCTVAKPYTAFSNGDLKKVEENSDGTRTFHYVQNKPHVSYLITLVVGEFATKTETWRGIPVSYHARPQHESKLERSFKNTPKMLEFFSEKIGVPYAWSKYAQVCCYGFGGGMENTSSTTLGERALYDERRILTDDPDGLIAHEMAHQWFGDLLTCREWAHIWLNEGFASYFEALWDEQNNGADEFAYNMRGKARGAIQGGRDHPVVWRSYSNPDEQFDSRAYPKGAWVLHMIRRQLGDELFWSVMKTYVTRFSHKTVETVDLRKTIEEVTGRSFERFFYDWTERSGSPDVKVTYSWLADDHLAKLTVEQTQKEDPFHFPLTFVFGMEEGKPHRVTHNVTERKCTFYVPLSTSPLSMSIDPEQAVLMTLTREQPHNIWVEQLHNTNASARIDAVQHLAKSASHADMSLLALRLSEDPFWAVRSEIAGKLGEAESDIAKQALLANTDAEDARVRAAVVEALSQFDDDEDAAKALAGIVAKGDPSYRVETAAIRGYAKLRESEAVKAIIAALDRESDREVIRVAVLESLGEHGGDDAFDIIQEWLDAKRPLECRGAAIKALGKLASRDVLNKKQLKDLFPLLERSLDAKPSEICRAAVSACYDMGPAARQLEKKVEALSTKGRRRSRAFAREALKKMRQKKKTEDFAAELREKLEGLVKENEKLAEELEKIKAIQSREVEASSEPAEHPATSK
ncbi:MAG: HEAT repeat domain-containing protein [Planctomycetes bacterium]|nr:HEAT repeat domain-containing protein [Planctomycetota bacterium]